MVGATFETGGGVADTGLAGAAKLELERNTKETTATIPRERLINQTPRPTK
jgi:hypothetical protein